MVLYSPLQMAADLPENYEKYPRPFQFIKDVPTDWADTRVLNGDYATLARKDRNGDDWYIGSVTDENARTLEVKLDFLDTGRTYTAQIYRDGDGVDWQSSAYAIVRSRRVGSPSSLLGRNRDELEHERGVLTGIDRPVLHRRARRVLAEKVVASPVSRGPYGPRSETAAAVGADVREDLLDARRTERAFVRADTRVGRIGRQRAGAVLARGPEFQHDVEPLVSSG